MGNCVAVGLSAGFLEPLEATGLVLIEAAVGMIAEMFPHGGPIEARRDVSGAVGMVICSPSATAAPPTSTANTAPGAQLLSPEMRTVCWSIVVFRLSTYSRGALATGAASMAWPASPHSSRWIVFSAVMVWAIAGLPGTSLEIRSARSV